MKPKKETAPADHGALAEALRTRILEAPSKTNPALRQAVAASATGGPPAPAPFDALARQIGEAAHRVTDAQVEAVVTALGTEKAAFEIVLAAAVGAGLRRWDLATKAVREARDATA